MKTHLYIYALHTNKYCFDLVDNKGHNNIHILKTVATRTLFCDIRLMLILVYLDILNKVCVVDTNVMYVVVKVVNINVRWYRRRGTCVQHHSP